MPLPAWDWDNPLTPLLESVRKKLGEKGTDAFEGAFVRYNLKYEHVALIWKRLAVPIEKFDRQRQLMASKSFAIKSGWEEYSEEERRIMRDAFSASLDYSLDYEDFFIHSRILLDRTIYFTRFLLHDLGGTGKVTTSFTKHRAFFLRNIAYETDKEYAKFIRERTSWYETMLRNYRDDFITHDKQFIGFGTITQPNEPPRPIRRLARPFDQEWWNPLWNNLLALRQKYIELIPNLKEVPLNAFELLDFFDSNSGMIQSEDIQVLNKLHLVMGAKMPDVRKVMVSMLEFLRFFGSHFKARLEAD